MAVALPAIVISINYRLAPHHRLPAAYDDCMEALHCIKTTKEEWLKNYADFSNCYIMGSSSCGNIAYRTALSCVRDDLRPLKIKGIIMHQPYFGGVQRTESEIRLANDPAVPLSFSDSCWASALPIGADRDHEFCNPTVGGGSPLLDQIMQLGWKFLVTGFDGDPLVDRQTQFVKMVEEKGVEVVGEFVEGGSHGIEFTDASKAKVLFMVIQQFMRF